MSNEYVNNKNVNNEHVDLSPKYQRYRMSELNREMKKLDDKILEMEKSQQVKSTKKTKVTKKDKGNKYAVALVGTALVVVGVPMAKDYKYQHDIDKENKATVVLEVPDNVDVSEELRQSTFEAFVADEVLSDKKSTEEEIKQAEAEIYEFMMSGDGKRIAEAILDEKIIEAVTYGEYTEYNQYSSEKGADIIEYKGEGIKKEGIQIKGLDGITYYTGHHIFEKTMPKNMSSLVEDIVDYGDWKNRKKCIKAGEELIQDAKTVIQEFYLLDEKGKMQRVNSEDFKTRKETVKKENSKKQGKAIEKIYNEYGVSVPNQDEAEIETLSSKVLNEELDR